ncbi:citrate synthase [Staphylococcus warneri]|jgi:citrate synthase|uniref:citrate synthase n=1 Tax=Staphylococcus warneri TaxID=1292 RepID=UPI0001A5C6E2|nr:citrate synthase [Staphylococcus warneri]MBE9428263.1 citrate synthase [Staphylococcus epidermidis]EEQ79084.1 2-methylcitrate synthase/citrate synthase II [Staphylococcus warneri L37603]MBO0378342.1 citrate synthase [Staphylococcus warneri]MCD8803239.1 citrate synthase [Staphylococcus warneri]MCD8806347.1 citrate synthase [Staphylococcus warneri]
MAELQRGLEGVIAAETKISSIIDSQLTYAGYDIDDLAENAQFEEIIFLLWNYRLPNKEELQELKSKLYEYMTLNPRVYKHFEEYVTDKVHPMAALRTSVSYIAHFDPDAEDESDEKKYERAIRIQAKIASLVTAFARVREGKEPLKPNSDLSYAGNFLYMLKGELPTDIEEEAFNKALILHADHELNASAFTARCAVSSLSDMYSGIVAAVGSLKGPLHGGANERVMAMLSEVGSLDNVDNYLDKKIANKEKIMGFGHRVYKEGDPRAKYLREMSRKITEETGQSELYEMSLAIEKRMKEEKGLIPNVDFFSASVYHSMDIPHDLFTPIFAVSRTSGWIAHILEQYRDNRIMRPRANYIGETNRKYVPIEER